MINVDNEIDLSHWDSIRNLSLQEASLLIAGLDPVNYQDGSKDFIKSKVYQRATLEAVQRANDCAWRHAKKLDRLLLYSEKNSKEIELLKSIKDIWKISDNYDDYLPSIEIRHNIREVNCDPKTVPVLLIIDPWYSATIQGNEFISWLSRAKIASKYSFKEYQEIVVTDKENNWDSKQNKNDWRDKFKNLDSSKVEEEFIKDNDLCNIPLSTRERNTLLSIIAALCKETKIDYERCAKSACIIKDLTATMGLSIGESTIESHLKRIPDALEARTK